MLFRDLVDDYKKSVEQNPELPFRIHSMREGVYLRINPALPFEKQIGNLEQNAILIEKKSQPINFEHFEWFQKRDYYSDYIMPEKKIGSVSGRIESTNILTYFVQKEILEKNLTHFHDLYFRELSANTMYDKLLSMVHFVPQEEREEFLKMAYSGLIQHLESDERQQILQFTRTFMSNNIGEITKVLDQTFGLTNKMYIRIFFDFDEEIYLKEWLLYMVPRIYNKSHFNTSDDATILGLHNVGITMNKKKPFQFLHSMKTEVPARFTISDAIHLHDLFQWMKFKQFNDKKAQFDYQMEDEELFEEVRSQFIYSLDKGSLIEFDNLPFKNEDQIQFEFKNVLRLKNKEGKLISYQPISSKEQLRKLISLHFFAGKLHPQYKEKLPKIEKEFIKELENLLVYSREAFLDYFNKGTEKSLLRVAKKTLAASMDVQLKKQMQGLHKGEYAKKFNLYISFLMFIGDTEAIQLEQNLKQFHSQLFEKLNQPGVPDHPTPEEFFYLAGQLSYYMIYQSKASDKNLSLFDPMLTGKDSGQMKRKLDIYLRSYSHALASEYIRLRNALVMMECFPPNMKLTDQYKSYLKMGILTDNLFLKASEKGKKAVLEQTNEEAV